MAEEKRPNEFRDLEVFQSGSGNCVIDFRGHEDHRFVVIIPGAIADKLAGELQACGYGNGRHGKNGA